MKVKFIIILVLVLTFFIQTESFGKKSKIKPLYTVLICNDDISFETFNGGLSYELIKTKKVKEALGTKENTLYNDLFIIEPNNLWVYPNPVNELAFVNFVLMKESTINIYAIDITNNKQILYSAFMGYGVHNVNVNLNSLSKGLIFIYLEVDGILSVHKVIKH